MMPKRGLDPVIVFGWLAFAACRSPIPDPDPRSVEPSFGYNGDDTLITVSGRYFYPQIEVDAANSGEAQIDDGFRVQLAGPLATYELSGVTLRDYSRLEAVVPEGFQPGRYDVIVETPAGREGALADAFTVTDTRADHVDVEVSGGITYSVTESAQLHIQLQDRDGEPVFDDLEIVLTAEADDGSLEVVFSEGLEDQQALSGVVGVRGRLGIDGSASIEIAAQTTDLVTLVVAPAEEESTIVEDSTRIEWVSGAASATRITLPESPFLAVAGETFPVQVEVVDDLGNPVDATETLLLRDACLGWLSTPMEVTGAAIVEVTLEEASSPACPENALEVVIGPPGESDPFMVAAAPVDHFEVVASPPVVVAGDLVSAFVTPLDAFGNPAAWLGTNLSVSDSVGGVGPGQFQCVGVTPIFCQAVAVVAADQVALHVAGDDGTFGDSAFYEVIPGDPVSLEVEVPDDVRAGEPVTVSFLLFDAWGNEVDVGEIQSALWVFEDQNGPVECTDPGESSFECVFTFADEGSVLSVDAVGLGLSAESSEFAVVNGPLSAVSVIPDRTDVLAGEVVEFTLFGIDEWGNPYRTHDDPTVQLSDTSESLSVPDLTFGTNGLATGEGTFTRVGETVVSVSQNGDVLGTSVPIQVAAGPADELRLTLGEPWVWVNVPVEIHIRAVDEFGNATDLDGTGGLSSETGATVGASVTLVNGEGVASVSWSAPEIDEYLDATVNGIGGRTGRIVVVDDCLDGPVVEVAPDPVACLDETEGTGPVSLDVTAASGSLVWIAGAVGDTLHAVSGSSPVVVFPTAVGQTHVSVLGVDADGCGAVASTTAWVAPNDGRPAGRLELELSADTIEAGVGSTSVEVHDLRDCTGVLAVGAEVAFRADRGELVGLAPGAFGLVTEVEGNGDVAIDWGNAQGGPGALWAWSEDGAAGGRAEVTVTGDLLRPHVLAQDPVGTVSGMIDSVLLTFDEPLQFSSVTAGNFSVTGPVPITVVSADLDVTGTEVLLTLGAPVDADAGVYSVTAWSNPSLAVRDEAGNRMDGAWLGAASSYVGAFGALPDTRVAVSTCAVSPVLFRPDGADGPDQEADTVEFTFEASETPERWVLSVWDTELSPVREAVVQGVGISESWIWDGRDRTGRVVPGGNYMLEVSAEDASGNLGLPCTVPVTVEHRYEE